MIKASNLKKVYSQVTVLDLEELIVPRGQSFGLVGNNGAGKTTFFRLILDLIKADGGMVESAGKKVAGSNEWKSYTGSFLDKHFLIDFLTPEEYFDFLGNVYRLSKGDVTAFLGEYNEFFNGEVIGRKKFIRDLSSGNQQKVGIAGALMPKPEVIILDEPFNALDPTTQIRLKRKLNDLRADPNVTMLISSHDLNHITEVCDRIVILEEGRIVHDLPVDPSTLKQLEAYFAV